MPVSDAHAYTCDPSSLLASNPCIACLSEKEMLAVLVGIIAVQASLPLADVMKDSACFTCMSKKQMLHSLVTIFGSEILGAGNSAQTVIDEMHCLVCATDQQLYAALTYLICTYWDTICSARQ